MERSAQKQRPISTQRSMSVMTINTVIAQNAYTPQLRRNNSVAQPRPRSVYSSEPAMSPDELTAKIADSFQQFSSMLNQMQKTTTHKKEQHQLHSPILSRPTTPSNRTNSKKHMDESLKDNSIDKTTVLSPISLFSPQPPSMMNNDPARKLSEVDAIFPLDSTQLHKDTHKKEIKKTRIVQDKQLVNTFLRAASNGDTLKVQTLLHECRDLASVADDDDQGPTALIYAACFGHLATVESLLDADAPIDEQDDFGWTALMWATVNHHDAIVDLLLSKGASFETQSIKGNTAFDFVLDGDTGLVHLLQPGSKVSRRHHVTMERKMKRKKSKQLLLKTARRQSTPTITTTTINTPTQDGTSKTPTFQHSGMDAYTHFMTAESTRHRLLAQKQELFDDTLLNASSGNGALSSVMASGDMDDEEDNGTEDQQHWAKYEASMRSSHTFVWDTCLVDQMFVFSMDNLASILDVALDTKSIPKLTAGTLHNKDELLWMPANLLFLCARFAYYYTGRGDLAQFFDVTIGRLAKVAKQSTKDTSLLCYWMTNIYQLLNYLKRDTGLERSTKKQQQQLSDLMADQYTLFIRDCERRLDKTIDFALLDYESIQDMLPVDFADSNDWSKFFQRRGSTRASLDDSQATLRQTTGSTSPSSDDNSKSGNGTGGPQTIITMLEGIHTTMTTVFELPGYMAKHTMVQCIFYVLCEGFNQLLANKKYLCRSKALHIRLNVSVLEEWARKYGHVDPTYGATGLERMTQLLQLLQCLSELGDGDAFQSTCQDLDLLNAAQIKRCVSNYRYETQETQLPKPIEEWVTQWAQQQQREPMTDDIGSTLNSNRYINQLKDYLMQDGRATQQTDDDQWNKSILSSTMDKKSLFSMDSRSLLPFKQPQTQPMLSPLGNTVIGRQQHNTSSESIYLEIKQKAEQQKKETLIRIPSLSHKLLDRLDKKLHK